MNFALEELGKLILLVITKKVKLRYFCSLALLLFIKFRGSRPRFPFPHSTLQTSKLSSGSFCSFALFLFSLRTLKKQHPTFPRRTLLFHGIIFTASSLLFSNQTGFTALCFSSFNQ